MRVLWIVHYPVFGGPHNRILRLTPILRERGIDVTAVLPDEDGNAVARLRGGGVPVIVMPLGRARALRDPREHLRLLRSLRGDVRRIRGAARATKADALILGGLINPQAAIAARLEKLALVWQVLDSRTPAPVAAALMPVVDLLADTVTFAGQTLIETHPGADRLRVPTMVSTPGVDEAVFRPSPERRSTTRRILGIPDDAFVVGCVANVNRQKGIEDFIRAAALVEERQPGAWFVVVGASDPTHREYLDLLQREIAASKLPEQRLIFAGDQTNAESWYPAMDVKLMTSVSKSEGTPTAILEAWACGVPAVATRVGAVDRLIDDGRNGYIVPPGAPDQIAERTLALLADPELRGRMGAAGREEVERRYTLEHVADIHTQALESALAARDRRGHGSHR